VETVAKNDGRGRISTHFLLTVLGISPRKTCYVFGAQQTEAQLAPLALIELLPETERPHCVVALCTPEAKRESLPLLVDVLHGQCEVKAVDVPGGDSQEDVKAYIARVVNAIPPDPETQITVDVTHGYRHFSFLTYMAVLYLIALRGVRLRGAYYGLLRSDNPSPFLDLRPLLNLPRWFHSLEVLRETGSALPMAVALDDGQQNSSAHSIACELRWISEGYLSGLPLELGRHAGQFCSQKLKPLRKILDGDHHLPLAAELVERLKEALDPFALNETAVGKTWKTEVPLSEQELERQGRVIDDLFRRESISTSLGLLNEWTVSWVAWRLDRTDGWLDFHRVRRSAASLLGAMASAESDRDLREILTEEQRKLGKFWHGLCELRNAYHHHGMRNQVLVGNRNISEKLKEVRNFWETVLHSCPDFSFAFGTSPGGRVLVSPMGKRPGVLFSALHACRTRRKGEPVSCLVICSQETEGSIAGALECAGYEGAIEILCLEDPFGGRSEIERIVKMARPRLLCADEVFVNVTGGTTLMGLVAEALADAARKLARPVRRFGLIDRRSPVDQAMDPFQTGEPFWLDSPKENGDDNND
jgi:CRISPR-associated DxTHG motif protein